MDRQTKPPADSGVLKQSAACVADLLESSSNVSPGDCSTVRRTQEALRQSLDELQTIYDEMVEGLLITDIETQRFVRVNRSMCRMLGYTEEELLGASVSDIHPPETVQDDLQRFQAVAEGRISLNENRPVLRKDGSVFYADISGRSMIYNGRPCLLGLFRDVTEHVRADEAILRAKREWERTFDSVPDSIAILDKSHHILRVNRAMANRLGHDPQQCIGKKCHELLHQADCVPAYCPHAQTLLDGKEHSAEIHLDRCNRDVFITTTPLKDERGELVGSVHVARDITDSKQAARKFVYLASFPERSPHLILEVRLDGKVRYMNPTASRNLSDLQGNEHTHPWLADWHSVVRSFCEDRVRSLVREVSIGHRTYQQAICYLVEDEVVRIYGLDITERKRAEEALRKEHRTLRHLLQSSDHERQLIAYEIHDELAQQLAGAIMQFQTYACTKETDAALATTAFEAGMALLQKGHFEARRLIAGVRPPILDEFGVVAAIRHLVNEQNNLDGPRIEFASSVRFQRLAAIVENTVYRIVQEALTNACQHSQSRDVRVSLVQLRNCIRVEIEDWGVGFDTKAMPKHHFGLKSIRQRTRLLGGKCKIQSERGNGTRVIAELPVVLQAVSE